MTTEKRQKLIDKLDDSLFKLDSIKDRLAYDSIDNHNTTYQLMDALEIERTILQAKEELERVQLAQ